MMTTVSHLIRDASSGQVIFRFSDLWQSWTVTWREAFRYFPDSCVVSFRQVVSEAPSSIKRWVFPAYIDGFFDTPWKPLMFFSSITMSLSSKECWVAFIRGCFIDILSPCAWHVSIHYTYTMYTVSNRNGNMKNLECKNPCKKLMFQ